MAHLSFNPDLPLVDQVIALATLTVVGDQPCAMALLGRCRTRLSPPDRCGRTACRPGVGYWNPLRPNLLAEQRLADTVQLALLVTTAARAATCDDLAFEVSK